MYFLIHYAALPSILPSFVAPTLTRFTAKQAKSSSRLSRTIAAVCLAPTARVMLVDAVWSGVLMGLALPLGPLLVARWVLIGQEQTADHGGAGGDGGGLLGWP